MVALLSFFLLYAFAFLQNSLAENEVSLGSMQMSTSEPATLSDDDAEELKKEELDIISLCTAFPSDFNNIIRKFIKSSDTEENREQIKQQIEDLKPEIEKLKKFANQYASTVQSMDPEANAVREKMISGANSMITSLEKIEKHLSSGTSMSKNEKIEFVKDDVKPTFQQLEEACLGQTKDILKNVLVDIKEEKPKQENINNIQNTD